LNKRLFLQSVAKLMETDAAAWLVIFDSVRRECDAVNTEVLKSRALMWQKKLRMPEYRPTS
jgi:hypothetical protein